MQAAASCDWGRPSSAGSLAGRSCAEGGARTHGARTHKESHTDELSRILAGHYAESARGYKSLWAPELVDLSRRLLDELPLASARRVLDSGAGVGSLLPEIAARSASALVVGSDISEGMVVLTPQGFPAAVADSSRLPFGGETFDIGILAFVLFHLSDPVDGLKEMSRVLGRGGTVGSVTWGPGGAYPARAVWDEALDAHHAAPIEVGFAKHELVDSPSKVRELLERTGFEEVRTWTGIYESRLDAPGFLAHRTAHGASKRRFDSLGKQARGEFLSDVRLRLSGLGPEDFVHREEVVYATALKPN